MSHTNSLAATGDTTRNQLGKTQPTYTTTSKHTRRHVTQESRELKSFEPPQKKNITNNTTFKLTDTLFAGADTPEAVRATPSRSGQSLQPIPSLHNSAL